MNIGKCEIYKNLHKNCFSIRKFGKVVKYDENLTVFEAKFVVQPAGRQKVLDQKHKNVHAFVRGIYGLYPKIPEFNVELGQRISYDPYKFGYFYVKESEMPIYCADVVCLTSNGVYAWTLKDYNQFLITN